MRRYSMADRTSWCELIMSVCTSFITCRAVTNGRILADLKDRARQALDIVFEVGIECALHLEVRL